MGETNHDCCGAASHRSAADAATHKAEREDLARSRSSMLACYSIVEYLACSVRSAPVALAAARRSLGAVAPPLA